MKRQKLMRFPNDVLKAVEAECRKNIRPASRVKACMSLNEWINLAVVEKLERIKR
jgi:hypothetical protein